MNTTALLAAFLAAAPLAAYAHGTAPAPAHGGLVVEDSAENWVELVVKGDQLTVWVLDEAKAAVPSARLTGKATLLVGGKSQFVTLAPSDANSLKGTLDPAASGKMTAVLSLAVAGKPTQSRFVIQQ